MKIHRCRFVDYTPHTITSLAFSTTSSLDKPTPYDLRLAVGRNNGDIEIWNPRYNWTHELTLTGSRGRSIEGLCWVSQSNIEEKKKDGFSSSSGGGGGDGSRLFSIGGSTYITEWDLKTGQPLSNYDCNAGVIWSIGVNKSGNKLAVGCDDGSVAVVDISGGEGSLEYDIICQRQDARVLSLAWNKDDQIIGGCADGRIRVWDYDNNKETKGRILATMRVDKSKTESTLVWSLNVLPHRNQLISGDSTGHIKIWDLKFFTLTQSLKVHDADALCIVSDIKEEKFYSAGIDRKIHQFDLINTKTSSKWVHSYNRLLHSNDIRSLAIYESKSCNILVSGGVERAIIIQNLQQFHHGKYKKLLINQQKSNVVVDMTHKMIALWGDQEVKIWKILESGKHKLVAKLTLSGDENLTSVDLKDRILVVSNMTSIKVFELVESKTGKCIVNKVRDEKFDSLVSGAKVVKLLKDCKLLILTPDEALYRFTLDLGETIKINLDEEIELLDSSKSSINTFTVTPDFQAVITSRFDGSVEVYPLANDDNGSGGGGGDGGDGDPYVLTKLSSYPHLIACHDNEKILVLYDDNKLCELNIKKDNSLLTPWSKRNSEFLPRQFTSLEDKPQGLFVKDSKAWLYGSTWICYFDLTQNIPINKMYKNLGNNSNSKKRNRNGLSIDEEDATDETDGHIYQLENSMKQSELDKLREQLKEEERDNGGSQDKPFWITTAYRPIMKVADFGSDELVVIERPFFALPTTPAFNLPKMMI
ncbi:UTP4 [Candida oxycetoniae]|uniref:UTP4 n=1 Tax=Candida oxycetoniae TaxID=497107 RepID=A0AAI9T0Y3_9ASCO|nr:UTP4 [Candida oxycetoniae]KAI3406211.2 UTP4 [Candida oxycetoniae]